MSEARAACDPCGGATSGSLSGWIAHAFPDSKLSSVRRIFPAVAIPTGPSVRGGSPTEPCADCTSPAVPPPSPGIDGVTELSFSRLAGEIRRGQVLAVLKADVPEPLLAATHQRPLPPGLGKPQDRSIDATECNPAPPGSSRNCSQPLSIYLALAERKTRRELTLQPTAAYAEVR